jgi:hypothetical protein
MKRLAIATLAILALAQDLNAASGNCVETILGATSSAAYSCEARVDTDSLSGVETINFQVTPIDPTRFALEVDGWGFQYHCACNPTGSVSNTNLYASKSFSCSALIVSGTHSSSATGKASASGSNITKFIVNASSPDQFVLFASKCTRTTS